MKQHHHIPKPLMHAATVGWVLVFIAVGIAFTAITN